MRFSLIRLNHTLSPAPMRWAGPDASDEVDESEVLIVDEDTQVVVASVMAMLLRNEAHAAGHTDVLLAQ